MKQLLVDLLFSNNNIGSSFCWMLAINVQRTYAFSFKNILSNISLASCRVRFGGRFTVSLLLGEFFTCYLTLTSVLDFTRW